MRLYLLSGGFLDCDRSVIFPGDDSQKRVLLPVFQLLIQSEGRNVLIDTGVPPSVAGDPDGLKRELDVDPEWVKPRVEEWHRLDKQLELLGLEPRDLDLVVNTHLHFDHSGGNRLFPGVPIAVQRADLEAMQGTDEASSRFWDAPGLQFRAVSGSWSPVSGVEMLPTPGHTPGHQSILVRLPNEVWLFTADAVYTEEHWRQGKLGAAKDIPAARESIARLHEVAEQTGATVMFSHDLGQWEAMGMGDGRKPQLIAGLPE